MDPTSPARLPGVSSVVAASAAGLDAAALRPCPFCGGAATLEADPWLDECVRIACGDDACRVRPRTEYLLVRYADELREAWNVRHPSAGSPPRPSAA